MAINYDERLKNRSLKDFEGMVARPGIKCTVCGRDNIATDSVCQWCGCSLNNR